ncbi:DgyrCDS9563 [Dimorphilus gyrociliatus]|uniref:DgyrCDS9563 n=1 Tax=Dimorphilus gyrociliatus TaxID=2664684 RepID=A0A7I8VXD2_9ANNE|nr:DgyrCDS9563 [Dimorphilus gyrociliatus]
MALNTWRFALGCGMRALGNSGIKTVPKVRNFSLSAWAFADSFTARSSWNFITKRTPILSSKFGHSRGIQTDGDRAFIDVLQSEIELEKKQGNIPLKFNEEGFKVEFDDALVTLTKNENGEKIVVKFSINNSTVEDDSDANASEKADDSLADNLVSKPAFVVSITKSNGYTISLRCVFPQYDVPADYAEQSNEEDIIEISEVTVLKNDVEWEENAFVVEGAALDGVVYDYLLGVLNDRGIDLSFAENLIEFSTNYEHKKYIEFLENLQHFAKSK